MPWQILVVWRDGNQDYLGAAGGRVAAFSSRKRAEAKRDFMMEGMEDEVQSINVVRKPPQ